MYEQISPHEFVQEVSVSSKKRFHVGKQNESVEFLSWLLNELHRVRLSYIRVDGGIAMGLAM